LLFGLSLLQLRGEIGLLFGELGERGLVGFDLGGGPDVGVVGLQPVVGEDRACGEEERGGEGEEFVGEIQRKVPDCGKRTDLKVGHYKIVGRSAIVLARFQFGADYTARRQDSFRMIREMMKRSLRYQ